MSDQRLRELLEERVSDLTGVDLVSDAWDRAAGIKRGRRVAVGVAAGVALIVVGTTTAVVTGRGDDTPEPPPATNSESKSSPKAERGGTYRDVPVWWAPSTDDEAALPRLGGSGLPERIDLDATDGAVPAGVTAVALFQLWGDEPGEVVVVGSDGASYSLDVGFGPVTDSGGNVSPPVTSESLSPDGRYAFFAQDRSLEVYDFVEAAWTKIPTRSDVAQGARWTDSGLISMPILTSSAGRVRYYEPTGLAAGQAVDADLYVGPSADDEPYGPIRRQEGAGARGMFLAGPVADPDGTEVSSVDALGAGGSTEPEALLAFSRSGADEGRWLRCCAAVGWLDGDTVLFESRWAQARILAWRVGTPDLYRVSDVRGWTPGEESYVASFADFADGEPTDTDPTDIDPADTEPPAVDPDVEVDGIPVWWSPDVAEEAELPWIEQSVLPREIDVAQAVQVAPRFGPGRIPFDRAVAAFPYPDTQDPESVVLVGPELELAQVDVTRLEPWAIEGELDVVRNTTLAPDGRHLAFAQDGRIDVFALAAGEWTSVDTDGLDTNRFLWQDAETLLVPDGTRETGVLFGLDGRRIGDGGAEPEVLFGGDPFPQHAPVATSTDGREARVFYGLDGQVPAPAEGAYVDPESYLAIDGAQPMALAFAERVAFERAGFGPVAVGWLDDETVVYSTESEAGHFLVAWRVGTSEFWKVSEIAGPPVGVYGGPSYADLSRG